MRVYCARACRCHQRSTPVTPLITISPKQAAANDPKIAEALKLIDQAKTENEAQAKETLQKAVAVLGNNAQALEVLMFIPGPTNASMSEIDEQIEKHNFSQAMTEIQSMSGMAKDSLLGRLSHEEIKAGKSKLALDAANSINDPFQRVQALINLVGASQP